MMLNKFSQRWSFTELSLSAFVLVIMLFFTYGIFVRAPYSGFYLDPNNGRLMSLYIEREDPEALQKGDMVRQIGEVSWEEYYGNRRQPFFEGIKPGEIVEIVVDREGTQLTIAWEFPGFNQNEFNSRFFNIAWLAYIYWFFGTAAQLFMRPRESIRLLLIAADYLTALWLILGSLSAWHLWESSILLHVVTWLMLPVYLHLHWIFPRPLGAFPKWIAYIFYGICVSLALLELAQILPRDLYVLAFLVTLLGSVVLQGIHFVQRPDQRREVGFLAIIIILVIVPLISLSISGLSSKLAPVTFLALPFIPFAYFYMIYRRQMGGLELRANRLVSIYAFLILLSTALLLLLRPAALLPVSHETMIFFTVVIALSTAFVSISLFPSFQSFVEQRFLGIKLPYQNLQETYSSRITASASISSLLQILEHEVVPSLLVRQFAFIQLFNGHQKVLLAVGVDADDLPGSDRIDDLLTQPGRYRAATSSKEDALPSWIRLILPLKIGDDLIGLWLLGRRDPEDSYPHAEIVILQSLANQTAIALSNILHAEQLRKMYQLDIERYEKERLRLALDLHDSVLNQLAVLRTNLGDAQLPPKFHEAYDETTQRLREIVSDLRPPMLMYGLKPAIEELADNLMERSGDKVRITVDLHSTEERYPQNIEQHLFRIVQESCENALRHAHAETVEITGRLSPEQIDLTIEDNGTGFNIGEQLELDALLADNHFGLAGIVERVHLIGAEIHPRSSPEAGTKIRVIWNHDPNEN
jgi:signal transduction histidine kinase